MSKDIIIGVDAGTSVIKSVAFDLAGKQLAVASVPNSYDTDPSGAATQSLARTWTDCAATLRGLGEQIPKLSARVAAISVTGQGDGTWLAGRDNAPVGDGWLWLDSRASQTAQRLGASDGDRARYLSTGTGLNGCQQGAQLAYMAAHMPDALAQAEVAFHCKDWLYLNLTGIRATDPSEACFTFGDFRTGQYDNDVLDMLGLTAHRDLLPEICDGTQTTHPLTKAAATMIGLPAGTPVVLGYVDVVCSALGAGAYQKGEAVGCTIVGTTGVHIKTATTESIVLNPAERTGYVMLMPLPGIAAHLQTNMASTLNIDWVLGLARDIGAALGTDASKDDLIALIDGWLTKAKPGTLLYHPYISDAGERGPFIDHTARASLIGLSSAHGYADLVRAVVEGLGMAARDCYRAMGDMPSELRLTGGAARSQALRDVLSATTGAPVRQATREEAGAAGAAMIAAVAIGAYDSMEACLSEWVSPTLGPRETPVAELVARYDGLFPNYVAAREALTPIWHGLAETAGNQESLA